MQAIKKFFNVRFPAVYKHIRKVYFNSLNHIIWLIGSYDEPTHEQKNDLYSKQFWDAQENWDYQSLATVLNSYFQPSSVLDVGCGSGTVLSAFNQVNGNLRLLGLENSHEAINIANQRGLEIRQLNITRFSQHDIPQLCDQLGEFDITLCLEVAEHLPFWYANKLLRILIGTSNTIIFSAAQPGQGGPLHLNEQPPEYWINKFLAFKYTFNRELSGVIHKELNDCNIPSWYKNNLLVFQKK